jgi:hypothetical protein
VIQKSTHVDLKRSLVINSHYQELKFNYRTFKFEHDHVCISQLRTFFRKLIFEKKMLAVLFLFWESIVEILLKVTLNTKNPIKKNPIHHSTMAKRKSTNNDLQNIHIKLKIE